MQNFYRFGYSGRKDILLECFAYAAEADKLVKGQVVQNFLLRAKTIEQRKYMFPLLGLGASFLFDRFPEFRVC